MDRKYANSLLSPDVEEDQNETETPAKVEEVQPPQRVRVRIGDVYHEVDESVASALEAANKVRDDAYFRKISEQGEAIKRLEANFTTRKDPVVEDEDTTEDDKEYYKSPSRAVKAAIEQAKKDVAGSIKSTVAESLTTAEQLEKYRSQFYGKYSQFVGKEDLVLTVYQKIASQISELPWGTQHEMIADAVDKKIQAWTGTSLLRKEEPKEEKKTKLEVKPVVTERGSKGAAKAQTPVDDDDEDDLSAFLKKERSRTRRR